MRGTINERDTFGSTHAIAQPRFVCRAKSPFSTPSLVGMLQQTARSTSEVRLYALLAGVGVVVWLVPWLLFDGKEAWDHGSYFSASLPIMAIVSAYAGFTARTRWWRWPLALLLAQYVTALALAGRLGNLFPLGIVAFAIFTVPIVITTWIGVLLARRRERPES
jgi:hypothetical protein